MAFHVQARLVFNVIQAADYYLLPAPDGFDWGRFGTDCGEFAA